MTQCKAATKKGDRCKRAVANGSKDRCSTHSKQVGPRNVSFKTLAQHGGSALGAVATMIKIYEFAEKHWPQLKLAGKIIKEVVKHAVAGRFSTNKNHYYPSRPRRNAGKPLRTKKPASGWLLKIKKAASGRARTVGSTKKITMAHSRRACQGIIARGEVTNLEAKERHSEFNLWFSQLPADVRRDIYKRPLNQKAAAVSALVKPARAKAKV